MNIITINPLSVIPAPWNTRSAIDEASIKSLAESIKADGIIQTPNCIKDEGGDIICFDGNRRVAAACLLGLPEIEVNLCDITEDEAKVKTVTANLQREDDDPLLASSVIASIGGDPEIIASKLGKTTAWVKRRAKLNALDDSIKAFVGKVTLEVLERVSDLDANAQRKIAKDIKNNIKWSGGNTVKWCDIRRAVYNLTTELDTAIFDTTECAGCTERTGAEWFSEDCDGKTLGRCLNCKCFKQHTDNHKTEMINSTIPADAEREKVEYRWSLPNEVYEEDRQKRDNKHPCAYYWFDGGELKVVWGRSRKVINAEAEAAKAEREAEREAERADRERDGDIEEKLIEWMKTDEGEAETRLTIRQMFNGNADTAADFIIDAICERFSDWWGDISPIIKAFPTFAENAEISEEDAKWYLDRHADEDED